MRWTEIDFHPPARSLRQFATAWLVVMGGIAVWQAWGGGRPLLALCLGVVAVSVGSVGLVRPALIRPIYATAMAVTFPIGWLVSNGVLALLFFGIFAPLAVLFRAMGRDALQRRKPEGGSYWLPRDPSPEPRRYMRQF